MLKTFFILTTLCGLLLFAACNGSSNSETASGTESQSPVELGVDLISLDFTLDIQPVIKQHCYKCHDAESKTHGVNLEMITGIESLKSDQDLAKDLIEVLSEKSMPPKSMLAPTELEYAKMLKWVQSASQ